MASFLLLHFFFSLAHDRGFISLSGNTSTVQYLFPIVFGEEAPPHISQTITQDKTFSPIFARSPRRNEGDRAVLPGGQWFRNGCGGLGAGWSVLDG
ncbi:hypothetical protein B9Z19DRAFT_514124 [Tuber borchii]|uniref:Secreted protein n=1 Tax=Tuber borchii TaxID=42251 RepID=A0A2T7A2Q9_TUBBO|nr:hypothetical protein B9Z19DRAFT_514124 [Tuber borchii]